MSTLPKISEAASLALHTVALLAANEGVRLTTKDIASVLSASEAHLSKVLQRLSKAGTVRSTRGPKGGFLLSEGAQDATLLDVYESIEGPLSSSTCLLGIPACPARSCILGNLVATVNAQVRDYLSATKVSQMAELFRTGSKGDVGNA